MRLPSPIVRELHRRALAVMASRAPDETICGVKGVHYHRWWLVQNNRVCNAYVHRFVGSDDDRAVHDHPWPWCSLILDGWYREITKGDPKRGPALRARDFGTGTLRFHLPWFAHRLLLPDGKDCISLFVTGPHVREWGFHCPQGWRHWRVFTAPAAPGAIASRGCGD